MAIARLKLIPRSTMKAKVLVSFPARVLGTDGITVEQDGLVYTIRFSDAMIEIIDDLQAAVGGLVGELRIVTGAGSVTVTATEGGVAINKTVGAATQVNLPAAASRSGVPVVVKDMKGDALTNNITVVPNGSETIDSGTSDVIDFAYQSRRYSPIAGVGWLITG